MLHILSTILCLVFQIQIIPFLQCVVSTIDERRYLPRILRFLFLPFVFDIQLVIKDNRTAWCRPLLPLQFSLAAQSRDVEKHCGCWEAVPEIGRGLSEIPSATAPKAPRTERVNDSLGLVA